MKDAIIANSAIGALILCAILMARVGILERKVDRLMSAQADKSETLR